MLKTLIPHLIFEFQSAFVLGQSIIDNVLLAFETMHYLKCKSKGKEDAVALKMDISKAFDRVQQPYLEQVLSKLGFHLEWIALIMSLVSTISYQVNFKGKSVGTYQGVVWITARRPIIPIPIYLIHGGTIHSHLQNRTRWSHLGDSNLQVSPSTFASSLRR